MTCYEALAVVPDLILVHISTFEVADDEVEEGEQRVPATYNQDGEVQDDGDDEEAVDDEDKVIYRVHV